jgi:uncharacterized protein YuzE
VIVRYDQTADALYIELVEGAIVARTEELEAGTLADVDEAGALVGIEVIRPARDWPAEEILTRYQVADGDEVRELIALWRRPEEPGAWLYPAESGARSAGTAAVGTPA